MSIPRILHQIWLGNEPPHPLLIRWRHNWKLLHPGWQHLLWRENRIGSDLYLVSNSSPKIVITSGKLRELLDKSCHLAQRANIWRYLVLSLHGGLYVDHDVEPIRAIDELVAGHDFVAGQRIGSDPPMLENAFIGCTRGHPVARDLVEHLRNPHISLSMGCDYLTEISRSHRDIHLLPTEQIVFLPPVDWETAKREAHIPVDRENRACYPNASAIHHWGSLWHKRGFVPVARPAAAPPPPPDGAYLDELRTIAARSGSPFRLRALEWGSGRSTQVLAEEASTRTEGIVVTIDHHPAYQNEVMGRLDLPELVHPLVADLDGPLTADNQPAAQERNYATLPLDLQGPWDLIVVDGRRRLECCLVASMIGGSETMIALHDYRRSRYQPALELLDLIADGPEWRTMKPRQKSRP